MHGEQACSVSRRSETKETEPSKAPPLTRADAARENGKKGGRPRKPRDGAPVLDLTPNTFGLSRSEERFVAEYLVDEVAWAAYARAHPRCTEATARTEGPAVLRKPHITAAVDEARRLAFVRQQMSGDEALARITNIARGDIGDVLPEADRIRLLPEDVRRRIKSIRETKFGREIVLYDALHANEVIAKATGKLKDVVKIDNLEDIMARANQLARDLAPTPAGGA